MKAFEAVLKAFHSYGEGSLRREASPIFSNTFSKILVNDIVQNIGQKYPRNILSKYFLRTFSKYFDKWDNRGQALVKIG